jgi:RimJ/RimL family protein N-acetyltransferase
VKFSGGAPSPEWDCLRFVELAREYGAVFVDPQSIRVRDFSEDDMSQLIDYWYHSPRGFIEAIGIDPKKLLPEREFEKLVLDECRSNSLLTASKSHLLTITYKDKAIGGHTLFPLVEGDHGVFHAHIWKAEMRGKGIAKITYPKACLIFMDRFNLNRILFKTPIQNIGAIRVKEQLRIRYIGEEIISFGVIRDGTRAKVFELTRPEAERLICRHESE